MRKTALCTGFLLISLFAIGSMNNNTMAMQERSELMNVAEEDSVVDSLDVDSFEMDDDEEYTGRGLNDIRFENFEYMDWIDNDYIRCLRSYLDDFNSGKTEDEELEAYRQKVRGKFVIASSNPFMMGGLLVMVMFVDHPDDIYSAWVYSSVDTETETILDYSVRSFSLCDEKSGLTTETLRELMKEHPEYKEW